MTFSRRIFVSALLLPLSAVLVAGLLGNQISTLSPLSNEDFYKIFTLTSFVLIFGICYGIWLRKYIFHPLHLLSEGLERIKKHDYSLRLETRPPGELADLYSNYNEILNQILETTVAKDLMENTVKSINELFFIVECDSAELSKVSSFKIRSLNPAASEMMGVDEASVKNTSLQLWIDTDFTHIIQSLEKSNRVRRPQSIEGLLKKISGDSIPLELSWARIQTESDSHLVFVLVGRDIRWKKEIELKLRMQEELLRESQSLSKMGSFRWEITTGKNLWTEEVYHILGLPPEKTVPSYELFHSLILPEDIPLFESALRRAHREAIPLEIDFRIRNKWTQEIVWIHCHGRTEYNKFGNPVFTYGTIQDITELRRAEQALISAKNEALKSSQAKSEFLARMSHEIRTPMNAIMGMAELLQETKLNEDQQYYISIFRRAGESLMSLINDILDISKIEAGEVSVENIPFDLKKILSEIADIMRPRAQEKGLQYLFDIHPGVSTGLMGDPTKLRQVLINLVNNAIKFTAQGHVRVSVIKNPAKKDSLMVSVSDSGIGIPESKHNLIFQKFSQADNSITRRFGGTGLGLAISKSLVELMGGQIWFKSHENMGTTFFFTIPYREQITHPLTHKPLPMKNASLDFVPEKQQDKNKKVRILVADDTQDNRVLFTHFLKSFPYEIIEAENGLEALNRVKSEKFDLIFMDVQMPEMDGYAATGAIRRWEKDHHKSPTPIIALTAHALSEDRQRSTKAGCDDHMAKPFQKEKLLEMIHRYS